MRAVWVLAALSRLVSDQILQQACAGKNVCRKVGCAGAIRAIPYAARMCEEFACRKWVRAVGYGPPLARSRGLATPVLAVALRASHSDCRAVYQLSLRIRLRLAAYGTAPGRMDVFSPAGCDLDAQASLQGQPWHHRA